MAFLFCESHNAGVCLEDFGFTNALTGSGLLSLYLIIMVICSFCLYELFFGLSA